jgi:hypothetical protein
VEEIVLQGEAKEGLEDEVIGYVEEKILCLRGRRRKDFRLPVQVYREVETNASDSERLITFQKREAVRLCALLLIATNDYIAKEGICAPEALKLDMGARVGKRYVSL